MKVHGIQLLPVRYSYVETESRQDGWGRLTQLSAIGGRLLTRFRLLRGDRLLLTFELWGEDFKTVPAQVVSVEADLDGYFLADLRFREESSRVKLGRALRRLVAHAKTPPSIVVPNAVFGA